MKIIFRRALRAIIKYLCVIAITKHNIEIIVVSGWHGTDIAREAIYTILRRNNKKARRIVHPPHVDWDIPLAILGVKDVPTNIFSWIGVILHTIARLLLLKPNPSTVILQVIPRDAGIIRYWFGFIKPSILVCLNSHAGSLNLELLMIEKVKKDGLLILNNDNLKTKSLAQGKIKGITYFGKYDPSNILNYSYDVNKGSENEKFSLNKNNISYPIKREFPEFIYPFLAASVAIDNYYKIPFEKVSDAINYFELPSEKIQRIFTKFIEDE